MLLWLKRTWSRLLATLHDEDDFRTELETHLQMMIEQRISRGMSLDEARRDARMRLRGIAQLEEAHRESRRLAWLDHFAYDLRFTLRGLRRNPRFALTAILTTSVAIGAATAVFSVVDRSLFRPLPYASPDHLVSIGIRAPLISPHDWLFAGTYQEWRPALRPFDSVTAWRGVTDCDRNDGTPERVACALVDHNFLPTLGVTPLIGRNFVRSEDEPGADRVALLSFAHWTTRFGASPDIIGRSVTIDGAPSRVVGVLPATFETPNLAPADFLLPLRLPRGTERQRVVHVIARLRSGLSISTAHAQVMPLFQRFMESAPAGFRQSVPMQLRIVNLRDHQTHAYRAGLLMLLGAVLSFLLMACANIASLLLARSESRRHEFAIRASLGASPSRLARQTLTESAVLGITGGTLGCLLASALLVLFRTIATEATLRIAEATIDLRVLLFALALSLTAALLFGLAPTTERLKKKPVPARPRRLRFALVSLQFALSLLLLTGTGLFATSLWRLQNAHLGFTPENVVSASFLLPEQRYASEERQIAFFRELETRLNEIPGGIASAITDSLPPAGDPRSVPWIALLNAEKVQAEGLQGQVKWRYVTPGYFATLGIPIQRGRAFTSEDRTSTTPPVIISESLARRLFRNTDPIGQTLRPNERIIGIASDARNAGLQSAPDPEFYIVRADMPNAASRNQRPPYGWRLATAILRSRDNVQSAAAALEQTIHASEPSVALVTHTLTDQLNQHLAQPRFHTALLSLFASIGFLLAAVGLYGLTSFIAATRTRELGVRLAIGATRADIIALMMKAGLAWTIAGMLAGCAASLVLLRLVRSLLFEVGTLDVWILAAAVTLLSLASLAGTGIPSIRASRIEPMQALRHD